MAFRKVTMIEIQEVLRQWLSGVGEKRIAVNVRLDPKTVRRYVRAAEALGLTGEKGPDSLTDERVAAVRVSLAVVPTREHAEAREACECQREFIKDKLDSRVRLTKVRKLLRRHGVSDGTHRGDNGLRQFIVQKLQLMTDQRLAFRVCVHGIREDGEPTVMGRDALGDVPVVRVKGSALLGAHLDAVKQRAPVR